jgi:uncharacterized protein YjbI with pentapeptide repeats
MITSVEQFLEAYRAGQRLFVGLEFEHGENFSRLELRDCTFKNCWFAVKFSDADLENCSFLRSNLKTSDFNRANLKNATIKECSLEATSFYDANIEGLIFEDNSCYGLTLQQEDFLKLFTV